MVDIIIKAVLKVILYGIFLLLVGIVTWYFWKEPKPSLQDILFWVGAGPVALFSVGMFGNFFGMGSSSYQMSRSVLKSSPNQRALDDAKERQGKSASGMIWVGSGLLVWLVSYFM